MKKLILSLSLLASFAANAAGVSILGVPTGWWQLSGGQMLVQMPTGSTGQPGCATTANRFAVDTTTAAGQQMAAALRYGMALGKSIQFYGTGTCTVYSDSETVSSLLVSQ